MKPETQAIAHEVIQKVVENPKSGMVVSGATVAAGWSLDANTIAVWVGIAVGIVSLYNQIMIALKARHERKKSKG